MKPGLEYSTRLTRIKPAIQACKDLSLKAIYSRSIKSAKSLGTNDNEVDLYSDDSGGGKGLDDLLKRTDISAVVIALPIANQPEYIRKSLLAGKHVLSEKPVAENVADAAKLVEWDRKDFDSSKATWGVAENFRYLNDIAYAAKQVASSGRLLGFMIKSHAFNEAGGQYYETSWRKNPSHQGGFLLDSGVHDMAGMRRLLGPENRITTVSAFTTQLQKHLPPVDTISAAFTTTSGVVGTLSMSFGTTFKGSEYAIATEKGAIICNCRGGVEVGGQTIEMKNERTGVPPEIRAWGAALVAGKPNPEQAPEQALADLELLEACLKSGEQGGTPIQLKYQTV